MPALLNLSLWPRRAGKTTTVARARAIQQVPELRACALCMHSAGQQPGPALLCHSPEVTAVHGRHTPCSTARQSSQACGPDARHMDMVAWHPFRQQARP